MFLPLLLLVQGELRHVGDHIPKPPGEIVAISGLKVRAGSLAVTAAPCEFGVKEADDATFTSVPVCLDARCRGASAAVDLGPYRFVQTTHGLGVERWEKGRRVASLPTLILVNGNANGAPPRRANFSPEYSYIDGAYAHFFGSVLGIWRMHVECRMVDGEMRVSVTLSSRYTTAGVVEIGGLVGGFQTRPGRIGRVQATLERTLSSSPPSGN